MSSPDFEIEMRATEDGKIWKRSRVSLRFLYEDFVKFVFFFDRSLTSSNRAFLALKVRLKEGWLEDFYFSHIS